MNWSDVYPRPQLKRSSYLSLNGEWTLNEEPILIPFPPQSRLSGYAGEVADSLIYTRSFSLQDGFMKSGNRVRLHFGAVDQVAEVWLNGRPVCRHEGGYLPFFADITDHLNPDRNELAITAYDPLNPDLPYGKQRKNRGGMWYTPVSGVWQSVWLESVPEKPIESLRIEPDLTGVTLTVGCEKDSCLIEIPGMPARVIPTREPVRIDMDSPHLWSPDDPHLYPFTVSTDSDRVESYFALRTVSLDRSGGKARLLLNGKPVFLNGVLDQGYFEDGIFLPSSPGEYEKDILRMKKMGFNLLRKHIKIEPEAFYLACDRLGMLVMQDMVNSGPYSFIRDTALPTVGLTKRSDRCKYAGKDVRKAFFTQHMTDTAAHLFNHPCIIAWTIFNEGWGQFNADDHYDLLRSCDPTRLIDSTSGWFHQEKSDFDSRHVYFRNKRLKGSGRAVLLSECGGYARTVDGHMFNPTGKYGYGTTKSEDELTGKIERMYEEMVFPGIEEGLVGLVYTQVSDIEDEINGLYTYDREICKVDKDRIRALNARAQQLAKNQ